MLQSPPVLIIVIRITWEGASQPFLDFNMSRIQDLAKSKYLPSTTVYLLALHRIVS